MAGVSVLYKTAMTAGKPATKKRKSTEDATAAATAATAKRRRSSRGSLPSTAVVVTEDFTLTVDGADGERPRVAFDDIIMAIHEPVEHVPKKDLDSASLRRGLTRLCSFLFMGKQDVQNRSDGDRPFVSTFTTENYSEVRAPARQEVIQTHVGPIKRRQSLSESEVVEPAGDVLTITPVKKSAASEVGSVDMEPQEMAPLERLELQVLLQESGWLFSLVEFLNDSFTKDVDTKFQGFNVCFVLLNNKKHHSNNTEF